MNDSDYVVDDRMRLCYTQKEFDILDDDLMHDLLGNERLARPVQSLLVTYKHYLMTKGSFGVDEKLFLQAVEPDLKALYQALEEEWKEQL